jgi:hypothetical protein
MCFGRIFGVLALVQSGLLRRPTTGPEDFWRALDTLLGVMERKSYLQEMGAEAVAAVLRSLSAHAYADEIVPRLLAVLGQRDDSPEKLAMLLAVRELFPVRAAPPAGKAARADRASLGVRPCQRADLSAALPGWGSPELLAAESLPRLARILRESTSSNPRVHAVWTRLLACYAPAAETGRTPGKKGGSKQKKGPAADQVPLDALWRTAVDGAGGRPRGAGP